MMKALNKWRISIYIVAFGINTTLYLTLGGLIHAALAIGCGFGLILVLICDAIFDPEGKNEA